jgi:hypothetical protein
MTTITKEILEMLDDDMVSHGLLAQCVERTENDIRPMRERVKSALTESLASGKVEIGIAKMATPDYVEFIAWKGTVAERVSRAMEAIMIATGADEEFAYWLCLRGNVDRFEGDELVN